MRALLIDLDGVIRRWDPDIMGAAERRHGLRSGLLAETAFDEALLSAAVTGALSDSEWRAEIVARLVPAHGERAALAVAQWSESVGELDHGVLELVRSFRRRHTVGLISNATSRLEDDLARLGIVGHFDHIFNSCRLGVRKPSPGIFLAACETLSVEPEECAFVDDTAAHVESAAELGLLTHHFRGTDGLAAFLAEASRRA